MLCSQRIRDELTVDGSIKRRVLRWSSRRLTAPAIPSVYRSIPGDRNVVSLLRCRVPDCPRKLHSYQWDLAALQLTETSTRRRLMLAILEVLRSLPQRSIGQYPER